MAQSLVKTYITFGLFGYEVTIEADANKALPTIEIIGLPDASVKEAKERLRASFRNLGIQLPSQKIVLNLAPSDIKKVGTQFDLPMAVAVLLLVCGHIHYNSLLSTSLFFGELGLDGSVKRMNGILPAVLAAKKNGFTSFFIPSENIHELAYIPGITIYPLTTFQQVADMFVLGKQIDHVDGGSIASVTQQTNFSSDFSCIQGHEIAKRALSIAAAGGHNVLLIGSPGSGKTLLLNALPSILPPLQFDEMLEVSQIYSLVGKLTEKEPIITNRPFRMVHHTASKIAIVGGGAYMQPGEISLAHKGILFFDELPEFAREVLEVLRQPLEDKRITISRAAGSVSYPAQCMFVAAMNPCPCGYYKDRDKPCTCALREIKRYQAKISGPLLDRIDMILEIPREHVDLMFERKEATSSETLRGNVIGAWSLQQKRFAGDEFLSNSDIPARKIHQYIKLGEAEECFLKQAAQRFHFSGRAIHRTLKLARTIADMNTEETIQISHLAEALQYRSKTIFIEGH